MELRGPKQIKNFRMADKQRNTAHQDKSKEEKSCAIGDMHFVQKGTRNHLPHTMNLNSQVSTQLCYVYIQLKSHTSVGFETFLLS
jgi:hypothetical protein